MIGQQKRTVDLDAPSPPAKFYKYFDESSGKTSKCVVVQAEGSKRLVKHFSATPVQSFCKSLNRGQLASFASILNSAKSDRKSGLLEAGGAVERNSSDVTTEERGDVVSDSDKEICIREGRQESTSICQSYDPRNALTDEIRNVNSAGAQEVSQANNCAQPCCTFLANRQDTLSDFGCSGAANDSRDICLNKIRVSKLKSCSEKCQSSTNDVSNHDLGSKHESVLGEIEIGCTVRKVELRESKVEIKPSFPFNITQNEDSQSYVGMSKHDTLNSEGRESMNVCREVESESTTRDYCTLVNSPAQACLKEWENVSCGETEDHNPDCHKSCPKGWENPFCGKTEDQDPDCHNGNTEGLQTNGLIQACNTPSRTSKVITLSAEPFLDLNKDLGVVRVKPYEYQSPCYLTLKEDVTGAKEESYISARQIFEGRTPEYAVKMGVQAFWNSQSPLHASVMPQTGPGSVCHGKIAYELLEFEVQDNLETPRRRVPVGPEFQAELPQLVSANKNEGLYSDTCEPDSLRWLGECIWPVWESESVSSEKVISSIRSTVCSCAARDSIQCVRLHVEEKREILRKELGKAFYAWGFDNMGEAATKHWMCEDKLTFHEVVRENPLSFWNELFAAFPTKQTRELVSYYFNVFVLQRRAIQNRVDAWNIDSDDDEMLINSEDEESESVFESDEEIHDSNIDDATSENDEINHSVRHAVNDFRDEENILCSSDVGDSSCGIVTNHMQARHELANASSKTSIAQISWMAGQKLVPKHSFDGGESTRNQGSKMQMRAWDTLSWDQSNPCNSNQKEGKLEVPQVACFVSGRQKSGDYSACNEGFIVNSQSGVLDQCDTKVWNTPSLVPSMDVDKLISTKGMMEEFFGAES